MVMGFGSKALQAYSGGAVRVNQLLGYATVMFPSNVPNATFHNVLSAMAMATPIAHKGAVAGAKAVAMTALDMLTTPELLAQAKDFFQNVQTKDQKYVSMLSPEDKPAVNRNDELMDRMRPKMEPFYYDAKKYPSYLDQLGVKYPPDL